MPFLDDPAPINLANRIDTQKGFAVTPGAEDLELIGPPRPSWNWGAAFRRNNEIAAFASSESVWADNATEPGFNPWEKIKGTEYEGRWQNFVNVRNEQKLNAVKRDIDREVEDKKMLDSQPWWMRLVTEGAASILSPTTLLPGGSLVRTAKGGIALVRSAGTVSGMAALGTAAQEGMLHGVEQTRTVGESAMAIGASAFLGGLLGAGGAAVLSKAEWQKGVAALKRDLGGANARLQEYDSFNMPRLPTAEEMTTSGRVETVDLGKAYETQSKRQWDRFDNGDHPGELIAGFADKPVAVKLSNGQYLIYDGHHRSEKAMREGASALDMHVIDAKSFNPGADRAPSVASKLSDDELLAELSGGMPTSGGAAANLATSLADNTIYGKAAGVVAGATAKMNPLLRIAHSPSAVARDVGFQLFENPLYLKKNFDGVASQPAVETFMKEWNSGLATALKTTNSIFSDYSKAGGQFKRVEFNEAIGKAMRRGDVGDDPMVTKAAQDWRARVFDPLKEAAIKAGLLPENVSVDTAQSYFSRMWDTGRLNAKEGQFKQVVEQWVQDNAPKWAEQTGKAIERRLSPLRREIDELEASKLRRDSAASERADVDTSEFAERDIRTAMRIVEGGAPKPKGVKTLTQFVRDAGGIFKGLDGLAEGELRQMGVSSNSMPGMLRNTKRRTDGTEGGWDLEDITRHAWENGYFPEHGRDRPSYHDFLDALSDDFNKRRAVVREGDREAYRLTELVDQLEQDLGRIGALDLKKGSRFSTSEEVKGMVGRVRQAQNAEADRKIAVLREKLREREMESRADYESRFGDADAIREHGKDIAKEVFDTLTGRTGDGIRPEFLKINARGPLKERTFNIPDTLVEEFLEHDVEAVARRYTRVMGADVELAYKFGSVDMAEQIGKIRQEYQSLRSGVTDEKELKNIAQREKDDIGDLTAVRDMLRGTDPGAQSNASYSRIVRNVNHLNYLRSMGEVTIASLGETVRPAMVHGLLPYMETLGQTLTNMKGIRLSVVEGQLAGNISEKLLGTRLATLSEISDPYASRSPIEAFLENMTNIASKWNGIRLLTDIQKSMASVMTQNRILNVSEGFQGASGKDRAYLAFIGIDQSMAERIAAQFKAHGETVDKVRVANTEEWTDAVAVRAYRAAMNKDVDSIIVSKGVADTPLFASTPTGKAMLQFKSFALASHQRVLLRGLQEDHSRFLGGLIAMTTVGMMATWMKAQLGNRDEKLQDASKNPGWWIAEGIDKSGIFSVPMELANMAEKATGFNPIKTPIKAFDEGSAISQKNQNKNLVGAIAGPTAGLITDAANVAGVPYKMTKGDEITQGDKGAMERLLPFNSYLGVRQILRYVVNPPQ